MTITWKGERQPPLMGTRWSSPETARVCLTSLKARVLG